MPFIRCADQKYSIFFKAHYLWNFILSYFDGQGTYIFRLIGAAARHQAIDTPDNQSAVYGKQTA